jgi:hypothetical protein
MNGEWIILRLSMNGQWTVLGILMENAIWRQAFP